MSYKIYMILLIIGMLSITNADSINEQIEAIKKAEPKERVEMMNRLKVQIAKMREQERFETLEMIQKNMSSSKNNFEGANRNQNMNDRSNSMQQFRFKDRMPFGTKQQGKQQCTK